MCKKRFFALLLAILMLCLTACTDTGTDTPPVGNSNSVQGTETVSSDQNDVGIPEISDGGTTDSDIDSSPSVGTEEQNSDQTYDPNDCPINQQKPTDHDTPVTTTDNGSSDSPESNGGSNSETPSGNGGASSDTPSNGSGSADNSGNEGSGSTSSQEPGNPGTNDTPSVSVTEPPRYGKTWLATQNNGTQMVKAYEEIVAGTNNMTAKISLSANLSESELSKVWLCYQDDYPEHFWLEGGYVYSLIGAKVVSVSPNYTMNATQKASAQAAMESQIAVLLNGLNTSMNVYDLEKAIHDRLLVHTNYVNTDFCHTAYGALVNKNAVCDGYSRAFQLLCRRMGIEVLIVRGDSNDPTSGNSVGHAWNVIKLGNDYYHIDTTWDDAGNPPAENLHYGWFNITTAQVLQDHIIREKGYPIPTCTATALNYYRKNNAWLTTLTVDGLVSATKKEGNAFVCKVYVENPGNFEAWINENINTLATRYGLNGYSFSMTTAGNELQYRFE